MSKKMSKVLTSKRTNSTSSGSVTKKVFNKNQSKFNKTTTTTATTHPQSLIDEYCRGDCIQTMVELDDATSNSSIMEFLEQEKNCYKNCGIQQSSENIARESDADIETIFQEINRLTDNSDTRTIDELIHEAELLLERSNCSLSHKLPITRSQKKVSGNTVQLNKKYTKSIENIKTPKLKVKAKSEQKKSLAPKEVSPEGDASQSIEKKGQSSCSFLDSLVIKPLESKKCTSQEVNHRSNNNINENGTASTNSTSKDINTLHILNSDDAEDGTDTIEEITEGMETIELEIVHDDEMPCDLMNKSSNNAMPSGFSSMPPSCPSSSQSKHRTDQYTSNVHNNMYEFNLERRASGDGSTIASAYNQSSQVRDDSINNLLGSPLRRLTPQERRYSNNIARRSSMTTPDSGISSQVNIPTTCPQSLSSSPLHKSVAVGTPIRIYCDKAINSSSGNLISTLSSPIESNNECVTASREHALKQEIEKLQERLKDTEERLESFRIQHDTLSQFHRNLRESNATLLEQSEILKLDVQHLNECANVLRSELQSARNDRDEAVAVQKMLRTELDETRCEKKRVQEQRDKDTKTIQDLQRQCREMERILMRKHPDSVSALIVASKTTNEDNTASRKLLEQRIAQLEADAKEQDNKAQQILANVQARFNSVQAKYETHIGDLETQVLSLQEINSKLNEKIESQVRTLDYLVSKKAERYYNNCTQTDEYGPTNVAMPVALKQAVPLKMINDSNSNQSKTNNKPIKKVAQKSLGTQTSCTRKDGSTNTIGTWNQQSANSSANSTAHSTPNNSRPNSKQSGLRKPQITTSTVTSAVVSKLPISQTDSINVVGITNNTHTIVKEDAHLLATIRGMRVDLAIKNKALQRLTRELDECKKTIKKLQKEKEAAALKCDKSQHSTATSSRNQNNNRLPATTDSQTLKETQNRYKLLEADYKTLHEKRLQDLKTLQTAHERELASCHETVRLLQQRLNERDEQFSIQKRRKLPVDYYALKAKVTALERRHTEREERLHMLVEALSKGRLNNALEDLLGDNNNQ